MEWNTGTTSQLLQVVTDSIDAEKSEILPHAKTYPYIHEGVGYRQVMERTNQDHNYICVYRAHMYVLGALLQCM